MVEGWAIRGTWSMFQGYTWLIGEHGTWSWSTMYGVWELGLWSSSAWVLRCDIQVIMAYFGYDLMCE